MDKITPRTGFDITNEGHVIARYIDKDGALQYIDLTLMMAEAAQKAVEQHKQQLHGHQL